MSASIKRVSSAAIGITPQQVGVYTAPSVTTGVMIHGLTVANILTTGANVLVTVYVFDGATKFNLGVNVLIMSGGSVSFCDEGNRQALNAGDQVFVLSNTAASVDALMSVTEIQ